MHIISSPGLTGKLVFGHYFKQEPDTDFFHGQNIVHAFKSLNMTGLGQNKKSLKVTLPTLIFGGLLKLVLALWNF